MWRGSGGMVRISRLHRVVCGTGARGCMYGFSVMYAACVPRKAREDKSPRLRSSRYMTGIHSEYVYEPQVTYGTVRGSPSNIIRPTSEAKGVPGELVLVLTNDGGGLRSHSGF